MGCCEVLLKAVLIITNVVVMVGGLLLLVVGGIVLSKKVDMFPELDGYSNNINAVLIPMMVVGGVLLVFGLIGCIGACTGKAGLLNVYFIVVLIIVILEIAIIIVAVVKKDSFITASKEAAGTLFDGYKEKYVNSGSPVDYEESWAVAVNSAQFLFECCGLTDGPSYWNGANPVAGTTQVAPGCCPNFKGDNADNTMIDYTDADKDTKCGGDAYKTDCTTKISDLASGYSTIIIIVFVVVIVFEVFCLFAACYSKKRDLVA